MAKNNDFYVRPTDVEKLAHHFTFELMNREQNILRKKVGAAVDIVWRTARAKRPMITPKQAKNEGRRKRVSNPGAGYGVPVDTGALQSAIKKRITETTGKVIGEIYVDGSVNNPVSGRSVGEYALLVENGTSKMAARPFMRPALALNEQIIRRLWSVQNGSASQSLDDINGSAS
jgi:HK97 gp10 family phage protein